MARIALVGVAALLIAGAGLAVEAERGTPQAVSFEAQDVSFRLQGIYQREPAETLPLCLPDCQGERHDVRFMVTGLPDLPLEARLDGVAFALEAIVSQGAGPGPQRLQLAFVDGPVWYDVPLAPGNVDEQVRIPLVEGSPAATVEQLGSIAVALAIDVQLDAPAPPGTRWVAWLDGDVLGELDGALDERLDGVRPDGRELTISIEPSGEKLPLRPTFVAWRTVL